MLTKRRKIVIVGSGFAGMSVANQLKHTDAEVIIIDKSNHHLFQPLLYQVATAALSPGDIAAPIRAILGKKGRVKVMLGEVEKIHKEQKYLRLVNGNCISFDQLVLAPGAEYNYFGNQAWKEFAPCLKTLGDALKIREQLLLSLEEAEQMSHQEDRRPQLTYVIIGGGPTGVEMAGAIAEIARSSMRRNFKNIREEEVRIYLVEAAPGILNTFKAPLGQKGQRMLEKLGVIVRLDAPVVKIEKGKVHLKDETIETSNIIWAAGIKAPSLIAQLGAAQDRLGRVFVREDLSLPGHDAIFVLGDSAHFKDRNGEPLPAMASVAQQQGEFLGKLLSKHYDPAVTRTTFEYRNKGSMATIGRARAVAEFGRLKVSGFFAWIAWCTVHILLLVGFRNRWRVLSEWVWNYFTFKRGVQLITDRSECHNCHSPKEVSSQKPNRGMEIPA